MDNPTNHKQDEPEAREVGVKVPAVKRPRAKRSRKGRASEGVVMALVAVVVAQILLLVVLGLMEESGALDSEEPAVAFLLIWCAIGWNQLLYLPLLAVYYEHHGFTETRNGVLRVCAVLFFSTSLCYGSMMW